MITSIYLSIAIIIILLASYIRVSLKFNSMKNALGAYFTAYDESFYYNNFITLTRRETSTLLAIVLNKNDTAMKEYIHTKEKEREAAGEGYKMRKDLSSTCIKQ